MAKAGWAAQAEEWQEGAAADPAHLRPAAAPAGRSTGVEGGLWAAALGSEAARLSGYLGLLARTAAFARAAGVVEAAVADVANASPAWPVALQAVAEAVGDEAGVHLRVVGDSPFRDGDPPLGLLAVDLDDPDVRAEATARLGARPRQLLPHVVVCLRSAQQSPLAGLERAPRVAGRTPAPGSAAPSDDGRRCDHGLALPAGRRLQPLSPRPWPAGPSAPGAVEWACTFDVTDHPLAGVLHLPTPASRSASRDHRRR